MRIGFITGEYPPMKGGVGAFTRELALELAAQGYSVSVFTRAAADGEDDHRVNKVPVVGQQWDAEANRKALRWAEVQALTVVNIQFQTAAYNLSLPVHLLPGRLRSSCRVVVTFHDLRQPYLLPKAGPLRTWSMKKMARDAHGVIATERSDETVLHSEWGLRHTAWVPIGSNITTHLPEDFQPEVWRRRCGAGPGDMLISYFGFLNESKGAAVLIEALALARQKGLPARLVMIGDRSGTSDLTNLAYGAHIDAIIASHGLSKAITWTGFVTDEQVSAYFYASDLTVLPYRDGASLRRGSLMAALAHGRAIITSRPAKDIPELEEAVYFTPADDPSALAQALGILWQDHALRRSLRDKAAAAAEHFTWSSIAERTAAFYESLL